MNTGNRKVVGALMRPSRYWACGWLYLVVLACVTQAGPEPAAPQPDPGLGAVPGKRQTPGVPRPAADAVPRDGPALSATASAGDGTVAADPEYLSEAAFRAILNRALLGRKRNFTWSSDPEIGFAMRYLSERAPIKLLRQYHDEVHAIGWVRPASWYLALLKAGTTREQRQRLRAEFQVSNRILVEYGDEDDMEHFVKQLEAQIAKAATLGRSGVYDWSFLKDLRQTAKMDFARGGPLTAFFIRCLNSPLTFPRADGEEFSLAYFAVEAYLSRIKDQNLDKDFSENRQLFDPQDPEQKAAHQAYMRRLEKYFVDTHGWKVSMQTPYLIAGEPQYKYLPYYGERPVKPLNGKPQEAPKPPPPAFAPGAGTANPPALTKAAALPLAPEAGATNPIARTHASAPPAARTEAAPRVPAGFKSAAGTKVEAYTNTGWAQEIVHERSGMAFAFIPAGEFVMGDSQFLVGDRKRDMTYARIVTLTRCFYLGKYEVTQAQWEAVMGNNPSSFKGHSNPVETVSWDDCQTLIKKLNAAVPAPTTDNRQPITGFRLPTEAEWEYACRAGTKTAFHYGYRLESSAANFDGTQPGDQWGEKVREGEWRKKTLAVGSFPPNAWGLYDMHGNVWEWCADWFGDLGPGVKTDPLGTTSAGQFRVSRGGGWFSPGRNCRSYDRERLEPDFRNGDVGCRLAYAPPAVPPAAAPDQKVPAPAEPVPVPGAAGVAPVAP